MRKTLIAILISMAVSASAKPPPPKKKPPHGPTHLPAPAPTATPSPSAVEPEPAPADSGSSAPAPAAAAPAAPAPAPAPPPAAPPPAAPPQGGKATVDLDALNAEYHALRDELFRSRAKAELLGTSLFKTRLVTNFQYKAQRAWPLKRVTLRLDDQPVYAQETPGGAEEPIKLYEGFLAPGRHALAVRVECGATGDSRLGYSAEDTFTFDVADGKQARVELTVDETGDGPQPLAKKKSGEFDVRVRAKLRSLELNEK